VAVIHRGDIQEGQNAWGFQDPHRRRLAGRNAAKDAIVHGYPFNGNFR
jgi:hypothetical protein